MPVYPACFKLGPCERVDVMTAEDMEQAVLRIVCIQEAETVSFRGGRSSETSPWRRR